MADLKKLAEEIVGLTLLEAQELKTILKVFVCCITWRFVVS